MRNEWVSLFIGRVCMNKNTYVGESDWLMERGMHGRKMTIYGKNGEGESSMLMQEGVEKEREFKGMTP